MNNIKYECLLIQKSQVENELNKTKVIELKIRKKREQIKTSQLEFDQEYQIADTDENMYKRLLNLQECRTTKEYRDGMKRTKEIAEDERYKNVIGQSKYNVFNEMKDLVQTTNTLNKEFSKIKNEEEIIVNKKRELENIEDHLIPTLEEELDLLGVLAQNMHKELAKLNNEADKFQNEIIEVTREITRVENLIRVDEVKIISNYEKLTKLLDGIEIRKGEIQELQRGKDGVRKCEIDAFKDRIFEHAGGRKKGGAAEGFVNHEGCPPHVPLSSSDNHCRYRSAIEDTVEFSLGLIDQGKQSLDTNALFVHLDGYKHSAAGGNGAHVGDLKAAGERVFKENMAVEKRIREEETKYQNRIDELKIELRNKEGDRDRTREVIISQENQLNVNCIELEVLGRKSYLKNEMKDDKDSEIGILNDRINTNNGLQESIQENISVQMERVSVILNEICNKRDEIKGMGETNGESQCQVVDSEVRWRYAQTETIMCNIGNIDKQRLNLERLEADKASVESKLKECQIKKHNMLNDLTVKKIEMGELMEQLELLIEGRNLMIEKRSLLETASTTGLVSTIKYYITELKKLKIRNPFLTTQYNRTKSEIIMRETYRNLNLTQKGTIKNNNGSIDNISNVNTLYKNRRHKNCQDEFNRESQSCMYYDAIDFISKALIKTPNTANDQIFYELKSKHENYKNHVLVKHCEDIHISIDTIKFELDRFDNKMAELIKKYNTKTDKTNRALELNERALRKKRKLDGLFLIDNFIRSSTELDKINIDESQSAGADCVSLDREELYLRDYEKMSIRQFVTQMISSQDSLEGTEQEFMKLIQFMSSHKDVPLEQVLLQTKDSAQKKFYKLLVRYFDKKYLKKKLEIMEHLNTLARLEYEARDIEREIVRIDKDYDQLLRIQDFIVRSIKSNNVQIGFIDPLQMKKFERMKQFCTDLCKLITTSNNDNLELINNYNQQIKELKNKTKTVQPEQHRILNIKEQILNNPLRLGLNTSVKIHRICTEYCDFYDTVVKLIDNTLHEINNGQVSIPAPGYKVAAKYAKRLIEQLNMSEHVKLHKSALERIIEHVVEIYRREKEIVIENHENIIRELELKVARLEFEVNSNVEHTIHESEKKIVEINNYIIFKRDAEFVGKISEEPEISDELSEYKEQKFETQFKTQVERLIQCLEIIDAQQVQLKNSGKSVSEFLKCVHKLFAEFFDDLSVESVIPELVSNLKEALQNNTSLESKFRYFIRRKTIKPMGGIEFILEKLSWNYQDTEEYDQFLDPIKIYKTIITDELQRKNQLEESKLEGLENELLALETQMKELSLLDQTMLRERLENINTCLENIKNRQEVYKFRDRLETVNELFTNRDKYYVFDLERRKVCIRLIEIDQEKKAVEIREIDRTLNFIIQQDIKLLEYRVLKEKFEKELNAEIENKFQSEFLQLQRKLLVKRIRLCGYDSFESSGEGLDEINSFISVIIGCLIGESSLYQIGCLNGVSARIEEWTRKIRMKNEHTNKRLEFIGRKINEEFKSDGLIIGTVNIIRGIQIKLNEQGKNITLIKYENKYLALVPNSYKENDLIDTNIQINIIVGILQTEEDLFKSVCKARISGQAGVSLHECKTLAETYKKEKQTLAKIYSIKDFNIFCHEFDSENNYLFTYLSYLEKLENMLVDPEEKLARLKTIKSLYDRILITMIKSEQKRRQARNVVVLKETQAELYLNEFIQSREGEIDELKHEMLSFEEKIAQGEYLVNELLAKKESHRDLATERISKLRDITSNLKNKMNELQNSISKHKRNEEENQEGIERAQSEIVGLESQLANVAEEIRNKQNDVEEIEIEIMNLKNRTKALDHDLVRMNELKRIREREEEKIKNMIEGSKNSVKLIENLKSVLSLVESSSSKIEEIVNEKNDVISIFQGLKTSLENINVDNSSNLWQLLTKDVNYQSFIEYVKSDNKLAGESQHNFINRLRAVVKSSLHVECEIVQELSGNKSIKKFKVSATNMSYSVMHAKVKEFVEKKLNGLTFQSNVLHSKPYALTGFQDLSIELKELVERRIELYYKSEEVESKKNAKFIEASQIINNLQIDYKDVVKCYVDEIEIIASGKFLVNESESYPGIDLTLNAVDMECTGENLEIDTSGRDGHKFKERAATHGKSKRSSDNKPKGDKGYDGYDGEHGNHGGNIVIKIENPIIGLDKLTIKANGGNGGEGQIGGNGDEGSKGIDGQNGVTNDTSGLGLGQTTIGFGSPGKPGGCGGSPGLTGRPGLGGKLGIIDIEHKCGKVQCEEMKGGKDAENILNTLELRPTGGIGGEPGLHGLDQVKDKTSFFRKTKTKYTVIDRAALCKKYPKFRDQIIDGGKVTSTNSAAWVALINPLMLLLHTRVSYEEASNPDEYRNREKDTSRGRNNDKEAALRNDERREQEQKTEAVNIDGLHAKLNDKKNGDLEISGQKLHEEYINDLKVEQDDIVSDIEHCTQEIHNVESDIENSKLVTAAKLIELENIRSEINSLQNRETHLNSERTGRIRHILSGITRSQKVRDKTSDLNLDMQNALIKQELYNKLCEESHMNKEDMIKIIDEYLSLVRGRLDRDRHRLKLLKKNYMGKLLDIKNLKKKLDEIRAERLSQVEVEVEIDQEIEEEIETQYVQEINYLMEGDVRKNPVKINQKKQAKIDLYKPSYLTDVFNISTNVENVLKQSIKHYRSGVHNDYVVNLIIEQISKNNTINKNILRNYTKEIKKIKMGNKINELTPLQLSLLLNQFRKISTELASGEFRKMDKDIEPFVFRLIDFIDEEWIIGKKLRAKSEDFLLGYSDLKNDIEDLIEIIENEKTFYLERCAIDFESTEVCELMLKYNNDMSFENLVECVDGFGDYAGKVENKSSIYLKKSIEGFLSTVSKNISYHGLLALTSWADFKILIEGMKRIQTVTNDLEPEHKSTDVLNKIIDLVTRFSKGVEFIKINVKSKKESNREIKSLLRVTKKLVQYAGTPTIDNIVSEYNDILRAGESSKIETSIDTVKEIIMCQTR